LHDRANDWKLWLEKEEEAGLEHELYVGRGGMGTSDVHWIWCRFSLWNPTSRGKYRLSHNQGASCYLQFSISARYSGKDGHQKWDIPFHGVYNLIGDDGYNGCSSSLAKKKKRTGSECKIHTLNKYLLAMQYSMHQIVYVNKT
jgi:hypothetical protein